MSNLTTRRIIFGLLMTFVLAFSVQGIADALSLSHKSNGGDLQTVNLGQSFTISFSVSSNGNVVRKPDYHELPADEKTDTESYFQDTTGNVADNNNQYDSGETKVSRGVAHYGNDDAIAIDTPSGLTVKKGNSTVPDSTQTNRISEPDDDVDPTSDNNPTASLYERSTDSNLRSLSGTVTLSCTATAVGKQEITITDVTPNSDFSGNAPTQSTITITIFVVNPLVTTASSISITNTNHRGFKYQFTGAGSQMLAFSVDGATDVPVNVDVDGGGKVFVQHATDGDRKTAEDDDPTISSAIPTDGDFNLRLDLKSRTSKVTLSHLHYSDSVTYIYGLPRVTINGGNNQEGIAAGRLEQALSVKVTDSRGAIAGIPVEFKIADSPSSDTTGNMFIPVPGTTVYVSASDRNSLLTTLASDTAASGVATVMATSTRPGASTTIFVQTDQNGVAQTYFQLGTGDSEDEAYVQAEVGGVALSSPFRHEVVSTRRIPTIEIVSGNSQRADSNGEIDDPLVVVVKRSGKREQSVDVTFITTKGFLQDEDTDDPGSGEDVEEGPAQTVVDRTNSSGEAEAEFFLGDASGVAEVVARIRGTVGTGNNAVSYTREVTFTING